MKLSALSTFSAASLALAAMVAVATPAQAGLFDMFKRNPDASQPGPTPPGGLADPGDANMGAAPMPVQSGSSDANAAMRMDRMEQQLRSLTGQVEELTYQVKQLQQQLQGQPGGTGKRSAAPAPATMPQTTQAAPPQATAPMADAGAPMDADDPNIGAPPSNLGQLSLKTGDAPIDLSGSSSGAAAIAPPPTTGDARGDYDAAYDLVLKGDYDVAETSFQRFLASYPSDPLAADAQYWIGESLYARQDYRGAADAFLAGYKQYPKSGKAPDMLLKLGLSLNGLGQREAACATFTEILKQYPKSSNALVQRVKTEQASASC